MANLYPYKGQMLTINELAALPETVVDAGTIRTRLTAAVPVTEAITKPKMRRGYTQSPWRRGFYIKGPN